MLLLTLRGTPTLYYGDELGMAEVRFRRSGCRIAAEAGAPGWAATAPHADAMGREPAAGFTAGEPWLPVSDAFPEINVEASARTRTRSCLCTGD